jgi:hypothetical protein
MEFIQFIFLATLIEGLVTYLFGEEEGKRPYLRYVSLALGITLAIAYRASIPELFGINGAVPMVDFVVTGLIIGRGANYLNDIVSLVKTKKV